MSAQIGFVGLGLMGSAMAGRLMDKRFPLTVWNRTKDKAEPLVRRGAKLAKSARDLAMSSNIVITMLSTPEVVEALSDEILSGLAPGGIHVDCSTISPRITTALARMYIEKGSLFIHAPVLGSITQAAEGSLLIFAGGDRSAREKVRPVLDAMAKKVFVFENVAEATHIKLLCNFFIASMIGTLSQSIAFARSSGVNPTALLEVISLSSLNAPMYQSKGPSMIAGEFAPRFFLEHMLKDVRLMEEAAKDRAVSMPVVPVLRKLFEEGVQQGLAKLDYSAILKVLEQKKPR
ncbi:MAG TPA: hypothetical protein DCX46_03945 [Bacteroidetes bacterium]|nr:MAG: hypothetical protein A2X68_00345 [Ignavibacteria bacterium GWC2_56_12]HAV22640.1 hypothetical protein [Bacteroidota bacterium]